MLGCLLNKRRKLGSIGLCNLFAPWALAGICFSASAADFLYDFHEDKSDIYRMHGEIQELDSQKFAKLLGRTRHSGRKGFLFLDSGGGRLDEADKIMEMVAMNKLATVVPDGYLCASACFNIFIAGSPRYAYPESRIGVHRVSVLNSVENQYTRGDSLELNETFKKYHVPDNIRLAMLDTPANDLHFLTKEDKAKLSDPGKPKLVKTYQKPATADFQNPNPIRSETRRDIPQKAEYPEYRSSRRFPSLKAYLQSLVALKQSDHNSSYKLNELEKTFRSELIRLTDKELDDYQKLYLKKATFQFEKQIEYTRKILNAARIQDKNAYNDVLLNLCNNQINDMLLLNNLISSYASKSDLNREVLFFKDHDISADLVLQEKFNNVIALCRAGYCDEELVRTQERTWLAGLQEFIKINNTNAGLISGFMIQSQITYLRDLSFALLGEVSRKPYFNRLEYASVSSLLNSLQGIQSDSYKSNLTGSDIVQYNAVLGGFLEAVLVHQMKMKGYDSLAIMDLEYSGDATMAALKNFVRESSKSNGYRRTSADTLELDSNIIKNSNLLTLLLENEEMKRFAPFLYRCEQQVCNNRERADLVHKYNDTISNLKKICNSRKCNGELLNTYNKMFSIYQLKFSALADKIGDNKLREHLLAMFYDQALYNVNNAVRVFEENKQ